MSFRASPVPVETQVLPGLLAVLGYPRQAQFIFDDMHTKDEVLEMKLVPVFFLKSLLDLIERPYQAGGRISRAVVARWEGGPGILVFFFFKRRRPLACTGASPCPASGRRRPWILAAGPLVGAGRSLGQHAVIRPPPWPGLKHTSWTGADSICFAQREQWGALQRGYFWVCVVYMRPGLTPNPSSEGYWGLFRPGLDQACLRGRGQGGCSPVSRY